MLSKLDLRKIGSAILCFLLLASAAIGTVVAVQPASAVGETTIVELDNPLGAKEVTSASLLKTAGTIIKGFLGVTGDILFGVLFFLGQFLPADG